MPYNNLPQQTSEILSSQSDNKVRFSKTFGWLFLAGVIIFLIGLALNFTSPGVGRPPLSQTIMFLGGFFFVMSLLVPLSNSNSLLRRRHEETPKISFVFLFLTFMFVSLNIFWLATAYTSGSPLPNILMFCSACSVLAFNILATRNSWKNLLLIPMLLAILGASGLFLLALLTSIEEYNSILLYYPAITGTLLLFCFVIIFIFNDAKLPQR